MHDNIQYAFPTHLIPPNSHIVIYGASQMGNDYLNFVVTQKYCNVVAMIDKRYKVITPVWPILVAKPDDAFFLQYDYILIASKRYHEEIRYFLLSGGIAPEKIVFAFMPHWRPSNSVVANLYIDRFASEALRKKPNPQFTRHPIHQILQDSLTQYIQAGLLELPLKTLELIKTFRTCDNYSFGQIYEDERLYYGHAITIANFANYYVDHWGMLPATSHGAELIDPFFPISFSGLHLTVTRLDKSSNILSLPIGPYIAYASEDMAKSELVALKKKLGRTLTHFYSHDSFFYHEHRDDKNMVFSWLKEARKKYETVMVCLHFNDITEELIGQFQDIGAVVVCAGVRTDQRFLSRLHDILELSDDVLVSDLWGSALAYSLYMGKKIIYHDLTVKSVSDRTIFKPQYLPIREKILREVQSNSFLNDRARELIMDMFGFRYTRSQLEIHTILELNQEITERLKGNLNDCESCAHDLLNDYIQKTDAVSRLKANLLGESLRS